MTLQQLKAELRHRRGFHLFAAQVVVFTMLTASWYVMKPRRAVRAEEVRAELNPALVAVLPFGVEGAHASLAYLGEGMVDLLALRSAGGRQSVDPRVAIAAWRDEAGNGEREKDSRSDEEPPLRAATRVATQLRAGTMLLGSVVGSGDSITVRASLLDVASGQQLANAAESGTTEELAALIDRLAAKVLGAKAVDAAEGLAALTSTSVAALQAYLEGNAHYRLSQYRRAVESYARALELDSTFALAALHIIDAAGLEHGAPDDWQTRGRALLLANRDRLPSSDRAYVAARFAGEPATSVSEQLNLLERLTREFPERPEAWYDFGDALYHSGALAGDGDQIVRARAAFERVLALDSMHGAALQHLLAIGERTGDAAFVAQLGERYLASDPASGPAYEYRLHEAHARGDNDALRPLYKALDTLDIHVLTATVVDHQTMPRQLLRLDFARRATELLLKQAINDAERDNARLYRYQLEMNAGRPHAAVAFLDSVRPRDPLAWERRRMYDAVYWDGDLAAAAAAAQRVERHLRRVRRGPLTDLDATALCALTTLRLARGQTSGAAAAIKRLRVPHPESTSPMGRQLCALKLAAVLSDLRGTPDAEARLLQLDSVLRTGPLVPGFREQANITAARLFEVHDDVPRALAAARRRVLHTGGQTYVSTFLELECRLALVDRDEAGATRACAHYLALRADPEPSLAERSARIRAELEEGRVDRQ